MTPIPAKPHGWRANPAWRAFTTPWTLISSGITAICILLGAPFMGGRRAFFSIGKYYTRQLFWLCGVKWSVECWEQLPEEIRAGKRSVIFMSNHESHFDPPFLIGAIPTGAVFMAKKEVRYMPLVGWATWAGGHLFLDRGHGARSLVSLKKATRQIREGKSVIIFPEGTRSRDGRMSPFKKGGFRLAMDAGVPIVPMGTVGGYEILPPDRWWVAPGTYRTRFGAPIDPSAFPDREALIAEVESRIRALVAEMKGGQPEDM